MLNTSCIMKSACVVSLLVLCTLIDTGLSLSCPNPHCEREGARNGCNPDPQSCPDGYVLREDNVCTCCRVCKKILCTYYISMSWMTLPCHVLINLLFFFLGFNRNTNGFYWLTFTYIQYSSKYISRYCMKLFL